MRAVPHQDAHIAFISHGLEPASIFSSFHKGSHSREASGVTVIEVERGIVALQIPGFDAEAAKSIAESIDRGQSGIITLEDWKARFDEADRALRREYITWVQDILLQHFPSVASAFQALDTDGDQILTAFEFAAALDSLAEISEDDMGKVLWSLGVHGGIDGGVLYYRDFVEIFNAHGL